MIDIFTQRADRDTETHGGQKTEQNTVGWTDTSGVKSICCSSGGPMLGSQHPCQVAPSVQRPGALAPGDLVLSSGLQRFLDSCTQGILTHAHS